MKLGEAVAELNPLDDLRQAVLANEFAPFPMRRLHEFEGHDQPGPAAEAIALVANGLAGRSSQADRWRHQAVRLRPDTTAEDYLTAFPTREAASRAKIVAELHRQGF